MKTVAVIPAFNEEGAILSTIQQVDGFVDAVVVVDDCSVDQTYQRAKQSGVYVLRHVLNRGQGAALQTGTDYAIGTLGADIIVHFDADGQMSAEDVPRMVQPVVDGEVDLTLGSRFLGSAEQMPFFRRVVVKGGILFTFFVSGLWLTDTHNGFRVLSRSAAEQITISLDRMAHASEILDKIALRKLRYREMPVTIRYTDASLANGQRSSAMFRVAYDFVKGKFLR